MICCDCEFRYKCDESKNVLTPLLYCERRNKFLSEKSTYLFDGIPLELINNGITTDFDTNFERLKELIEADKEGRCLILPCREGDIVYKIDFPLPFLEDYPPIIYNTVFHIKDYFDFGKTVFLTEEEAERALEAKEK